MTPRRFHLAIALVLTLAAPLARPAAAQTLTVDTADGNTPYSLTTSATYTTVYDGNTKTGEIDQSAGTLTVGNASSSGEALFIGYNTTSTGTYDLSGTGTLVSTNFTDVGTFGQGTMNQTGGTANFDSGFTDSLAVGAYNGSVGTYNQSAGTVLASGIVISDYAGSKGTYNLDGGTLTTGAVIGGANGGTDSTFNFNGGTLQATGSTSSFFSGLTTANVRSGGAVIDTNSYDVTISQALVHSTIQGDNAQDGGLTKIGAGTLTLTGAGTYTGATFVNAGTLAFGNGGSLDNNNDFVVQGGATLTLATGSSATVSVMFIGSTGAGNVTQSGGSVTTTPNTGSYVDVGGAATGTYTLSGGKITTDQLEAGVLASGTFTMTEGSVIAGAVRVGVTGGGVGIFNQNGGTVTVGPPGTLGEIGVLLARDASSSFDAAAVGTYNLNGGTLATPLVEGLGGTSTFNFNGGTLTATASDNPSAASNPTTFFSGLTTAQIRNGGAIIYTNGYDVTIASTLTHSDIDGDNATDGGLTKNASGSLTLTANNTYTGNTLVNAGALYVNNTPTKAGGSGTGSGSVYVNTGAWLGGTGTVGGSVTVGSGGPSPNASAIRPQLSVSQGTLTPGVNGPGTLTINGSLTLTPGLSMTELDLGDPANVGSSDLVKVGGNLAIGGDLQLTLAAGFTPTLLQTFTLLDVTGTGTTTGTFENTTANGTLYANAQGDEFLITYDADADGDLQLNDVTATFLAVPEPSAWAMAVLGGAGLAGFTLRRRFRRA